MLRAQFKAKHSYKEEDNSVNFGNENGVEETTTSSVTSDETGINGHSSNDASADKTFPQTEKEVYEVQLTQLQEQLVAVMIDNEDMKREIGGLKSTSLEKVQQELEEEKKRYNELLKQLKDSKTTSQSGKGKAEKKGKVSYSSWYVSAEEEEGGKEDGWIYLPDGGKQRAVPATKTDQTDGPSSPPLPSTDGPQTSHTIQEETKTTDSAAPSDRGNQVIVGQVPDSPKVSRIQRWKRVIFYNFMDFISDFMDTEGDEDPGEKDTDEPLAVKRLKENITRFGAGIQPITRFAKSVNNLSTWKNPAATLVAFIVYMYSVWKGYFIPLILLMMIWKLTLNYLESKGIISASAPPVEEEDKEEIQRSLSDKFQLVLQVAGKVQNKLGHSADSLEKMKNLLMWQHPAATKKLYLALCAAFMASMILPVDLFIKLCAMQLGIKIFIVTPIYNKFPKVQKRHDTVAQLWDELPTDADLNARTAESSHQSCDHNSNAEGGDTAEPSTSAALSEELSSFHERFGLPGTEHPLPGWEVGYRCTLMNKDKPLAQMKHGRLYLTPHYICFERSGLTFHQYKNMSISLSDVTEVHKAKPLAFMPGTGMALEIHVNGVEKPHLFGGIIGRDEAHDAIHRAGKALNLAWANIASQTSEAFSPTVRYIHHRAESF